MLFRSARERSIKAGPLVRLAARILGGGGGGRDDVAQGGGQNSEALDQALDVVERELGA